MVNILPKYWKQIIFLLIITPFLTELLTLNVPAPEFFKSKIFLSLTIMGYAPVLLLRELAARWRLGFIGYILLGLVYGLYNEGLLAQTIFNAHLPNPAFDNYGIVWSINFPWAVIILIFHAFYAFFFPILIIYYAFPAAAKRPWIDKKIWLIISSVFFIYISLNFLKKMPPHVTLWHYIFIGATMILLIALSKKLNDKKMFEMKGMKPWVLCLGGFIFVITTFTVSDAMIKSGIKPAIFILYLLTILCVTITFLKNKSIQPLMVFCLAAEITFAAGALLVAKHTNSISGMITEIIFIVTFLFMIILVIRNCKSYIIKNHFIFGS